MVYIHIERSCVCIAIHRKFQTRRAAEDSTRLYGEAAQHRMRLSVDGYKRVAEQAAEGLIGGRRCNSCRNPRRYAPSPCGTSIARVAREDWGEGSKREK